MRVAESLIEVTSTKYVPSISHGGKKTRFQLFIIAYSGELMFLFCTLEYKSCEIMSFLAELHSTTSIPFHILGTSTLPASHAYRTCFDS